MNNCIVCGKESQKDLCDEHWESFPKCERCNQPNWHSPCDGCLSEEEIMGFLRPDQEATRNTIESMHDATCKCNTCLSQRTNDVINWPKHYNMGKIEVIEAIESWDLDFRLANVIKYVARAGKKDPNKLKEDLMKAKWYLERFLEKECSEDK